MKRRGRATDRGVVAVMSVFFVMLLLTFLALSINVGRIMKTRGDLQHAADSAALAVAEGLVGDVGTMNTARETAQQYIDRAFLTTGARPLALQPSDVKFGFWHHQPGPCIFRTDICPVGFEEDGNNGGRLFSLNAVQVTARYALPTILGGFLGIWDKSAGIGDSVMGARSTVISRRSRVSCALPVAVPNCRFENPCFMDHVGDFNCHDGSGSDMFKPVAFTSGSNNASYAVPRPDPDPPFTPNTDQFAFGRIDILGKHDHDWNGSKADFVRAHTVANQEECANDGREYQAFAGEMSSGPFDPTQKLIEPFVEGMLGIESAGAAQTAPCTLGQRRVIPVVQPTQFDGCGQGVWPSVVSHTTGSLPGKVRILGYATVIVRSVVCSDGKTILHSAAAPANGRPLSHPLPAGSDFYDCNDSANVARIQACTAPRPRTVPPVDYNDPPCTSAPCSSGHLRVNVEFYCGNPVGLGENGTMALQPRLMH